jgi:hypothetical protein
MKTLYEELISKGLSARELSLELALTIPYDYLTDLIVGLDNITYKSVKVERN